MTRCAVFLVVVLIASGVAADDEKNKAVKEELDKLRGQWKLVSHEFEGKEVTRVFDEFVVIDGDNWTFDVPRVSPRGKREMTGSLDPTQNPKVLDLVSKPKSAKARALTDKCIYKLDRDTLTICSAQSNKWDDTKKRPKEFKTTEGGSIWVYQRVVE